MIKLEEKEIEKKLDNLRNEIEQIIKPEQLELLPAIAKKIMDLLLVYPYVEKMITKLVINYYKGDTDVDVEEIVEDTLVKSVQKVRDKILEQTYKGGKLAPFAIGIARYILYGYKTEEVEPLSDEIVDDIPTIEGSQIIFEIKREKEIKFQEVLKKCLSERQIKLLMARKIHKKPHTEIRVEFGFASIDSSKDAVSRTTKKLKGCVKANPKYEEWFSYYNVFSKKMKKNEK